MTRTYAYGIDFGTTNSAVGIVTSNGPQALPIGNGGERSVPSIVFFPGGGAAPSVADTALHDYIASGMRGRLVQSIKTLLHLSGQVLRYSAEDLVAIFLKELKRRADSIVGYDVNSVVLGRPVNFSLDTKEDADAAEKRLRRAAEGAGFTSVHFQLEPIAAAFAYERQLTKERLALIADLGGGTSDFAVVRLNPDRSSLLARHSDIVSADGVYVGGDELDAALMKHRIIKHFASHCEFPWYGKTLPFPSHLLTMLTRWYLVPRLQQEKVFGMPLLEFLDKIESSADDGRGVRNLSTLLRNNLSYLLFQSVESAKRGLSFHHQDRIQFHQDGIEIEEPLSRPQFEDYVRPHTRRIEECVTSTLQRAELSPSDIDAVFLTGGTSFVPAVRNWFSQCFGKGKLVAGDAFLSVVEGLATEANRMEEPTSSRQ